MDRYIILKNPLVLTFDKKDNVGYFNIVIKNNIIYEVDYDNHLANDRNIYTKYPGVNIIDAKGKIVIPSFFNSHFNSSSTLSSVFFDRATYDNLSDNLSLMLLEKYFVSPQNSIDLKNLVVYGYYRAISNGELFINDSSSYIYKEFLQEYSKHNFLLFQDIFFSTNNENLCRYLSDMGKPYCYSVNDDFGINNYTLSNAFKMMKGSRSKLFLNIMQKSTSQENIKKSFGKSLHKVFEENQFPWSKIFFANPVYLLKDEMQYLADNNVNIVISPSDMLRLSERKAFDIINYPLNICIGTGFLGKSVLSELRLLSHLSKGSSLSYKHLLKMAVVNPAIAFELIRTHGSIEKNKFANLIIFDVSDIRNYFIKPEITSENLSRHIIENLDSKDISDIIIKGNVIRRDYQSRLYDSETMKRGTESLCKKVFEIGKYFEFREKHMMRKRINNLSVGRKEEKNTATKEITYQNESFNPSESEFKVIGVVPNKDLEKEKIEEPQSSYAIFEINKIDEGLKFPFKQSEPEEEKSPDSEPVPDNVKIAKKTFVDNSLGMPDVNIIENSEPTIINKSSKGKDDIEKKEEAKKVTFKKGKLKFGFSDDD